MLFPAFDLRCLRHMLGAVLAVGATAAWANPGMSWPAEVDAALARAKLPREALSVYVADAQDARATARLAYRAQEPVNPASVMKLVTTYAALDLLGPAYTWSTPVYIDGVVQGGSLKGNVYIQGQGDPKLVLERLWLLLRRLQAQGVQVIVGDIVLDRSAFAVPAHDPGRFDGEPLRPYNAAPDALLLNYKSVVMDFGARCRRRCGAHPVRPAAGRRAEAGHRSAGSHGGRMRRLAPGAARRSVRPDAHRVPGRFPGQPVANGSGLWRMPILRQLCRTGGGRHVARAGRQAHGQRARWQGACGAQARPCGHIARSGRGGARRQQIQQQRDGAARLSHAGAAAKNGAATLDGAREALRQWWQARLGDTAQPVARQRRGPEPRGAHQRPGTWRACCRRPGSRR
jgi:D-alanyl-D-alanine carboxypeptidase/D-alanyl-D-alanine-endopeptidase (penicillin-binding protein 4)